MKMLGVLFLGLIFSFGSSGQEVTEAEKDRKERKEARKAEQRKALEQNLDSITSLVNQKSFALEADMLRGRFDTFNMLQDNNFIKVNGDEVIVQTANASRVGVNGLGGITARGRILTYEVDESKKAVNVNMTVSSLAFGNFNIYLSANASGNATAYLRGNFGLQATFLGDIEPINDITQYQGITRF